MKLSTDPLTPAAIAIADAELQIFVALRLMFDNTFVYPEIILIPAMNWRDACKYAGSMHNKPSLLSRNGRSCIEFGNFQPIPGGKMHRWYFENYLKDSVEWIYL